MPAAHLTVSSFRDLCVATAPYVVNLVGIVSEVGDIRESGCSGQPVRDFKLVDNAGASLSLIAFGASTEDAALAKKNKIAIYFAQVRAPDANQRQGSVWMFGDEWILDMGAVGEIPAATTVIEVL